MLIVLPFASMTFHNEHVIDALSEFGIWPSASARKEPADLVALSVDLQAHVCFVSLHMEST